MLIRRGWSETLMFVSSGIGPRPPSGLRLTHLRLNMFAFDCRGRTELEWRCSSLLKSDAARRSTISNDLKIKLSKMLKKNY